MADIYISDVVQLLNVWMDLDEVLYSGDDVEGDLDAIFFNLIAR
jgi:hypothetical protein